METPPFLAPGTPARRIGDAFAAAGHPLFLVGGSVRDTILRRPGTLTDIDLTTAARPDTVEKILRATKATVWLQGARFGTVAAELDGHKLEITTFRRDVYHADSRKPEVVYGDSLEIDLSRRDFTVNAMALALPDLDLHDPHNGLQDLLDGRLRTPLAPEISFADDPLRMLRACRFVSTHGLRPVPEVLVAIEQMRERLAIVSAERIRDELDKLLVGTAVEDGLWLLVDTGLAEMFLPELPALRLEQDPIHRHKDVLSHTIAVVGRTPPDGIVRLAALLHDIGKPKTRAVGPGGVSFHHHEVVGARLTEHRMRELRYPVETIRDVRELVYLHLRIHTYAMGWTDRAVRRYVRDAGPLVTQLNLLVRADCTTRNARRAEALQRRVDDLEARIAELAEREELLSLRPAIDGHRVMALLGIPPGRGVGRALDFLMEIRLDEGEIAPEDAERRLLEWWSINGD